MKNSTLAVTFLLLAIGFSSCAKKDEEIPVVPLQASLSGEVHISQPVTFTLPSVASTASVTWKVEPNKATINATGNAATISFQAAGTYTVSGVFGSTSGNSTVKVDSVNYLPPNGTTTVPFSTGEQLNITVKRVDSSVSASGLLFEMKTAGSYTCLNNAIAFTQTNGTNSYALNLTGINIPMSGCQAGSSKPAGIGITKIPLPAGTTTLAIGFNGTAYTGSIVKTNNSYVITWNYTSGVVLSPLSL